MNREWKPGDVIVHPESGRGFVVEVGYGCSNHSGGLNVGLHVHYEDGDWDMLVYPESRPIVVLDPEDREQVAILLSHYHSWKWTAEIAEASITDMQAALREFADPKPPKEPEPTGLGAVVLVDENDREGRWTRSRSQEHGVNWREEYGGRWSTYADLNVVRVLSHGVTNQDGDQ